MLNIPIPIIFTAEEEQGEKTIEEVVDGQQRLTAIFSFIDGDFPSGKKFKLGKLKVLKELSNKKFTEIEEKYQERLMNRELQITTIKKSSDEDIKFEMFERLNTNITKLNDQELRNCLYRGTYNDFLKELAKNKDFQYILNNKNISKRMLDCEYVLFFCAFHNTPYDSFSGSMKQLLNEEMRQNRDIDESKKEKF